MELLSDSQLKTIEGAKVGTLPMEVHKSVLVLTNSLNALSTPEETAAFFQNSGNIDAVVALNKATKEALNKGWGAGPLADESQFDDVTVDRFLVYVRLNELNTLIEAKSKAAGIVVDRSIGESFYEVIDFYKSAGISDSNILRLFKLGQNGSIDITDAIFNKINSRVHSMEGSNGVTNTPNRELFVKGILEFLDKTTFKRSGEIFSKKVEVVLAEEARYKTAKAEFDSFISGLEGTGIGVISKEIASGFEKFLKLVSTEKGKRDGAYSENRRALIDGIKKVFDKDSSSEIGFNFRIKKFIVEANVVNQLKIFFEQQRSNQSGVDINSALEQISTSLTSSSITEDELSNLFSEFSINNGVVTGKFSEKGKTIVSNIGSDCGFNISEKEIIDHIKLRGKDIRKLSEFVKQNLDWRNNSGKVEFDNSFGTENSSDHKEEVNVERSFSNLEDFELYVNGELAGFEFGRKEVGFDRISKLIGLLVENTYHKNSSIAESAKVNLVFLVKGLTRRIHPSKIDLLLRSGDSSRKGLSKTQSELADIGLLFKFGKVRRLYGLRNDQVEIKSLADFVNGIKLDPRRLQGILSGSLLSAQGLPAATAQNIVTSTFATTLGGAGIKWDILNAGESLTSKLNYLLAENVVSNERSVDLQDKEYKLGEITFNAARDIVWKVMERSILFDQDRRDGSNPVHKDPKDEKEAVTNKAESYFSLSVEQFAAQTEKLALIASTKEGLRFLEGENMSRMVNLLLSVILNPAVVDHVTTAFALSQKDKNGKVNSNAFIDLINFFQSTNLIYPSNIAESASNDKARRRLYQVDDSVRESGKNALSLVRPNFLFDVMLLYSVFAKLEGLGQEKAYIWVPKSEKEVEIPKQNLLTRLKIYNFVLGFVTPETGTSDEIKAGVTRNILLKNRNVADDVPIELISNLAFTPSDNNRMLATYLGFMSAYGTADSDFNNGVQDRTNMAFLSYSPFRTELTSDRMIQLAEAFYINGNQQAINRYFLPAASANTGMIDSGDVAILEANGLLGRSSLYNSYRFMVEYRKWLAEVADTGVGYFKKDVSPDNNNPTPTAYLARKVSGDLIGRIGTTAEVIKNAIRNVGFHAWAEFKRLPWSLANTAEKGRVVLFDSYNDLAAVGIWFREAMDKYVEEKKRKKLEIIREAIETPNAKTAFTEGAVGLQVMENLAFGISPARYIALKNHEDTSKIDNAYWADRATADLYETPEYQAIVRETDPVKKRDLAKNFKALKEKVLKGFEGRVLGRFEPALAAEIAKVYFEFTAYMRTDPYKFRTMVLSDRTRVLSGRQEFVDLKTRPNGFPYVIDGKGTFDLMLSIPEIYFSNFRTRLNEQETQMVMNALDLVKEKEKIIDPDTNKARIDPVTGRIMERTFSEGINFVLDDSRGEQNVVLYVGKGDQLLESGHRRNQILRYGFDEGADLKDTSFSIDPWNAMKIYMALVDKLYKVQFDSIISGKDNAIVNSLTLSISNLHKIIGGINVDNAIIPIRNSGENQRTIFKDSLPFHKRYQSVTGSGSNEKRTFLTVDIARKLALMSLFASAGPVEGIGFKDANVLFESTPAVNNLYVPLPLINLPLIYGNRLSFYRTPREGIETWMDYFRKSLIRVEEREEKDPSGKIVKVKKQVSYKIANGTRSISDPSDIDVFIEEVMKEPEKFAKLYPNFMSVDSKGQFYFKARLVDFEPYYLGLADAYINKAESIKAGAIASELLASEGKTESILTALASGKDGVTRLNVFVAAMQDIEGRKGFPAILRKFLLEEVNRPYETGGDESGRRELAVDIFGVASPVELSRWNDLSYKAGLKEFTENARVLADHTEFVEVIMGKIEKFAKKMEETVKGIPIIKQVVPGLIRIINVTIVKSFADILPASPAGFRTALTTGLVSATVLGVGRALGPNVLDFNNLVFTLPVVRAGLVLATGLATNLGPLPSVIAAGICAAADASGIPFLSSLTYPFVNYCIYQRAGFGYVKSAIGALAPIIGGSSGLNIIGNGFAALANPVTIGLVAGGIYENRFIPWMKQAIVSESFVLRFRRLPLIRTLFNYKRRLDENTFGDVHSVAQVGGEKLKIDLASEIFTPKHWIERGYRIPTDILSATLQAIRGIDSEGNKAPREEAFSAFYLLLLKTFPKEMLEKWWGNRIELRELSITSNVEKQVKKDKKENG